MMSATALEIMSICARLVLAGRLTVAHILSTKAWNLREEKGQVGEKNDGQKHLPNINAPTY
eukprot:5028594-Amphidinium_carterae.1